MRACALNGQILSSRQAADLVAVESNDGRMTGNSVENQSPC